MTNLGFHRLMEERGVRVLTTDVGDRYVLEALYREGGILGGEQSGHVICLRDHVTGDGLASALQLCGALGGRRLSEAAAQMERYPQASRTACVAAGRLPTACEQLDACKRELDGQRARPCPAIRHGARRAGPRGGPDAGGGRNPLC